MRAGFYGAYGRPGVGIRPPPVPPRPPAAVTPEAEVGHAAQICVSGCTHSNVGPIVRGDYNIAGSNHNKPAYKKEQKVSGLDVMLYYWDDRDGVAFCGWWFGPKIGGDQVWAYQPTRATETPPQSGWKVPYDGPVDLSLCVTAKAGSTSTAAMQAAVRQLDAQARSQQIAEMKKAAEEQKRKLEEARVKAEENRKKLEEANKKRIEDEKRRLEESKKKAEEQKSAFAIRQAFQKMKLATLENFDKIHEEVAKVMQQELEKCGSLKATIQAEHDKGWEQVKLRMEQLQAAKQKLQEQKKVAKERAEAFVEELEAAVASAEAAASVLKEAVDSLTEAQEKEKLKPDQVNDMIFSIDTATQEANDAYQVCTQLMRKNDAMKGTDPELKDLREQNSRLMQRMAACSMMKDTAIKSSSSIKTEALKKAKAKVQLDKDLALFSKYDSNKDGVLEKKEISTLAKKEYSFTMPDSALTTILKALVEDGAKGVKREKFQSLKIQIGIARERAKDLQRRKRREAHEKEIENVKDGLRTQVEEVSQRVKEAEESVAKVEEDGRPLHAKGKDMKAVQMQSFADEIELQLKAVKELVENIKKDLAKVKAVKELVENIKKDLAKVKEVDSEVAAWLLNEVRPVEMRHAKLEPRLTMLSSACSRFRDTMKSKDRAELLAVEQTATDLLRHHLKRNSLRSDELCATLCDMEDGQATSEASFLKFFETAAKDPEANGDGEETALKEEELKRLFKHWDEEAEGSVNRETLLSHIRKLMKVVKTAALTDELSIKASKSIRRLSEGEVVEALGVEEKDEDADLVRLKVKAMTDGAEGWVSVSGNQGTLFLKDGGHLFKVVKETILTESFALDGQSAKEATRRLRDEPRKLKTNELVQVRSWMKKEEKSGLMRMKCRAISDGAIGPTGAVWPFATGSMGMPIPLPILHKLCDDILRHRAPGMLKLFFLATAAAGHKLALLPANEVSRTALLQDASIEPSADPDDGQITNFQSILRQLTNAVASINSPSVTPISSSTSAMESEKSTHEPEVFSLKGPSSATEAPHPLMGSLQPSPIPRRLLFNHKFNLLKASDASLDKQSKLLRDNVRHIVKLFPDIGPSDVHFWDDGDCQAGIEQLQLEESEALGLDFAREKVGMVKSDLCRLVMMYSLGGFYFDTDILPLPNLEQHLEPKATFATVIADDGKNYFQAFLAATPKHPAILESLKEFKKWYDQLNRPGQNKDLLRRKTANGNIGTALLRKAFHTWSRGTREDSVVVHTGGLAGHVSQFFVEKNDQRLKGFQGLPSRLSGKLCNYAVVDRSSKTVVMFSRIYDKVHHQLCREEVQFMHSLIQLHSHS